MMKRFALCLCGASLLLNAADDAARLDQLFAADWAWQMKEFPERASMSGAAGDNGRWTDLTPAAIERRKQHPQDNLKVLDAIDAAQLSPSQRLNYELFRRQTMEQIEGQKFPSELLRIDPLFEGVHRQIPYLLERGPQRSVKDYEDMLKRLDAAPALIDQNIALLREGLANGDYAAQDRAARYSLPDRHHCSRMRPAASVLMKNFQQFPFNQFPLPIRSG